MLVTSNNNDQIKDTFGIPPRTGKILAIKLREKLAEGYLPKIEVLQSGLCLGEALVTNRNGTAG